jgi:ubiquinone biosynthesis protein
MAALIDLEKSTAMRVAPRIAQILIVFARHKFMGALFGRGHWPAPRDVRETFEELGLVFLKFGQMLALRSDLLPSAYTSELKLLHDQLPTMDIEVVRGTVEAELGARRHAMHPATFRRRRSGPIAESGGCGASLQPKSRAGSRVLSRLRLW